jgi:hypothetical protein
MYNMVLLLHRGNGTDIGNDKLLRHYREYIKYFRIRNIFSRINKNKMFHKIKIQTK